MKIQKVFSKRTADTWEMVARVQNYKKENRNVKETPLPLCPHKFMNLPPSLKK